jgi:hypothetical protein
MSVQRFGVLTFCLLASCGDDGGNSGTGSVLGDGGDTQIRGDSGPASDAGAGDSGQSSDAAAVDSGRDSSTAPDTGTLGSEADAGNIATPPPPQGSWINATGNLAGLDSECGNMSSVTAKPDEDMLIAGVALRGLWSSTDNGTSWHALGTGAGSASITNRPVRLVFDPMSPKTYYEAGLYNDKGVYLTQDDGLTFAALGDISAIDVVSVDFTDPERKTLLAGGHEQEQKLYRSTDRGTTWTPVGSTLPAKTNCSFPLVIDAQTHLVGCAGYGGGPTGIYRTANGGQTWMSKTTSGGAGAPLVATDGSIYWSSANNAGMVRSTDSGQTWTEVVGSGVLVSSTPIELPDGRLAALSNDAVVVSADHGKTWRAVTTKPPITAVGLTYSKQRKAFFVSYFSCMFPTAKVPSDAIMRFDYDYSTP